MNEFEQEWIVQTGTTALVCRKNVYTDLESHMGSVWYIVDAYYWLPDLLTGL